jgi:hypothetical protein
MKMSSRSFALCGLIAAILAGFCFSGLLMNASFSAASDDKRYMYAAIAWTGGGLLALVLATVSGLLHGESAD